MPVEYLSDRYHPTTEKTARLKVRSIRTVIDVLFHTGLDEIMVAAIPGIKIVRKAYTRPPQEDCAGYFLNITSVLYLQMRLSLD